LVAAAIVLLAGVATAMAMLRPNDDADWQIALAATTAHPDAAASVRGWNTDTGHESGSPSRGSTISPASASTNFG